MMPARRIEFTVPEEMWIGIEVARGDVPRAAWIKRALESALGNPSVGRALEVPADPGLKGPAPTRASAKAPPEYVLPKIAPRRP